MRYETRNSRFGRARRTRRYVDPGVVILSSVQSSADASVPGVLVALAVAALILTVLAVSVPEIVRAWHRSNPRPHDPATCDCKATR